MRSISANVAACDSWILRACRSILSFVGAKGYDSRREWSLWGRIRGRIGVIGGHMRRVSVLLVLVAAVLLALPVAAQAFVLSHGRPAAGGAGHGVTLPVARHVTPAGPPLLSVLSGAATLSVNVLTFAGLPDTATVDAYVWGATDYGYAGATTTAGVATLTGLPAATANGELVVGPQSGGVYDLTDLSWPSSGTTTLDVRPGALPMIIYRSTDAYYNNWDAATVVLNADENGQHWNAVSDITRSADPTVASASTITPGSATLDQGAIYYWTNEGAELPVAGLSVSPGAAYPGTITTHEADAQAIWLDGWGSGKPGTATYLVFERFLASGWSNDVTGHALYPYNSPTKSFGAWTSNGSELQAKKVTIPTTVKPGYAYDFTATHTTGSLTLDASFQTCTLAASSGTIRRGASVRLSGIVPTQGHAGSTPGKVKTVVIYKRSKSAGQPYYWDATKSGWTKVGTAKTDRFGKYHSALLRPSRSTWYVVRYPADAWYWGAFTSVRKVTVR
jgi:hypothetical protein